jgi:hypothetical protein
MKTTPDTKKDWPVWLAVAIPFAMVAFVAASIYLPRLWAPEPRYGFLYQVEEYGVSAALRVEDGVLVREEAGREEGVKQVEPRLYLYDAATGESRGISFGEAGKLRLDDRKASPDGFTVKAGGGYGGPFGGSSGPSVYLAGHGVSKKLDLRGVDSPYEFQFIGWVEK